MTIVRQQEPFLERDKAMKKTSVKKLHLNRDTLRELIPGKLELARGGTGATNFTQCVCSLGEDCVTGLCISDACPTALCA
jgi:hypothetical protein